MATFGNIAEPTETGHTASAIVHGSIFTLTEAADIVKITVHHFRRETPMVAQCNIYMVDENGNPYGPPLGATEEATVEVTEGYQDFYYATPLHLEPGKYFPCIGVPVAEPTTNHYEYGRNPGEVGQSRYYYWTYGVWADPFLAGQPASDYVYCMYVTYIPTAAVMHNVSVESSPVIGVPVIIDGEDAGVTPTGPVSVEEGSHTIAVPSEVET